MLEGHVTDVCRDVAWADLAIERLAGSLRRRSVYQVSSMTPGYEFGVHENNLKNMLRGIRERVFAVEDGEGALVPPPRPCPGYFGEQLTRFAREFRRKVVKTTPMSDQEFLDTYEGRRRTIYQNAIASLAAKPVNRRDAYSGAFLKAEKIPFYSKPDPAPRLIHPRSPRYNAAVGVFIKKIEHEVYHTVNRVWKGHAPTILKGYNATQVGGHLARKWNRFRKPVALGLDASRFDQHVSVDALRWEHERYLSYFRTHDRAALSQLLDWQLRTKVWCRSPEAVVSYTVEGMRFSGDMNTGLGNCLLMCAMVWTWARIVGVQCELANNGDDCVVVMEQSDLAQWNEMEMKTWFRGMGFNMKVEKPVYVLEKIEFCQSHPVWTGSEWLMVRKHGHAMAKDCISIKPLTSEKVFDKWRKAVGEAGLSLTGGIPVQQAFYLAFMRGSKQDALRNDTTLETGFMRFARDMHRKACDVLPEARYSYWLAFNVTPDEQEALEAIYDHTTPDWSEPSTGGQTEVCTHFT